VEIVVDNVGKCRQKLLDSGLFGIDPQGGDHLTPLSGDVGVIIRKNGEFDFGRRVYYKTDAQKAGGVQGSCKVLSPRALADGNFHFLANRWKAGTPTVALCSEAIRRYDQIAEIRRYLKDKGVDMPYETMHSFTKNLLRDPLFARYYPGDSRALKYLKSSPKPKTGEIEADAMVFFKEERQRFLDPEQQNIYEKPRRRPNDPLPAPPSAPGSPDSRGAEESDASGSEVPPSDRIQPDIPEEPFRGEDASGLPPPEQPSIPGEGAIPGEGPEEPIYMEIGQNALDRAP